ncbi:coiled-coil domain-containing protein 173 [Xenopus laevis]|uniref:Coiled-coil domain-containing protein 173 n=2 Tax=Xenopus laevis TaxID=8355 RepID=A0A1L8EW53_XENLA|nr:coiled-coil domain-containing protein 173 [Xenopus laevis]OCT63568.1 hypothetical protein XELAEV_18044665mg [Xenopus laevis]
MMATTLSAPVVQHGRRKGLSRAKSAGNNTEVLSGIAKPKPIDLMQVTVFPKAEWERIVSNTNTLEEEARQIYEEKKEREALHLKSKEVVKNWTNTIAGMRQKRLESKKLREEKEEKEKKLIDLEEAKFQAQKRKEAIEKARLKQYYQNDKVKTFHSALLLTEVAKERELQIELKNKILAQSKKNEKHWQRELEEGIAEDQRKALQQLTDRRNNSNELLKQIEEQKHKAELENIVNQREGEEIQRLTRDYEMEMRKLAQHKIEQKQEMKRTHLAHISDRDFVRALEKQKEEDNDEMLRHFVLAKRKMGNLRKAKEVEMNRQVEENRDKITELLSAWYKQKADNEEERTAKAMEDQEAKQKKEAQEKEEKIKADIKAITEHRLATRKKKEDKEKEEKMKALQTLYSMKESDHLFLQQQQEKMRRAEEESRNAHAVQVQQMAEKKVMAQSDRQADIQYAKQSELLLAKEEEEFQDYANQVIDVVTRAGRNPYALKKAAESGTGGGHGPVYTGRGGIRPSYLVHDTSGVQLPSYKNGTTQEIKGLYDSGDIQHGKRKLGFTW